MSKETVKELIMTNPAKKAKKKGKKKGAKKSAKRSAKAGRVSSRRKKGGGKRRSTRGRRRNPEGGLAASAAQFAGGALAYVVARPLAHLAGSKVKSKVGRGVVKAAVSAVVPGAAGVFARKAAPNLAAGFMGAAGAMTAAETLGMLGTKGDKPVEALRKMGFTQIAQNVPDSIVEKDGLFFRVRPDGTEEALAGLGQPQPVLLNAPNGQQVQALLLGEFEDQGVQLVRIGDQFALVPSAPQIEGTSGFAAEEGVGDFVSEEGVGEYDDVPSATGGDATVPASIGGYQG